VLLYGRISGFWLINAMGLANKLIACCTAFGGLVLALLGCFKSLYISEKQQRETARTGLEGLHSTFAI